ncbi:helix-turn-helix domain-containing protein [Streptomyces sp. NPDC051172]|uniref:nSTAND1 domain-containing NTPase n=1 Tax=Streptomyces sp. NPDC051172 TaxID=3155796 RepID=UPI00343B82C3
MAGRPESPLDPSTGPVARFAAELRKLRAEAGSPTYRVMAQRAGQGTSTLSQAAGGERLPTLPVVLAYVRACGGNQEEWEERWRQAAAEAAAQPRAEDGDVEPPYRGLARFEPGDANLFFGRAELTDRLVELTRSRRFTAVFGPSGSGKSSLLRAGLIPRLRTPDPAGPQPAALRVLTPGEHPLRTHEQRLTPKDGDGDTWLLVDQFEELYTLCHDPAERDHFIDCLLTATHPASRLRVVISVRADFLGHCAEHPALTAALQDGTVLAGPMSRDELRQAIVKPAQAAGLIVERSLTERILDEVGGEPGALPLMSHALLETWRRRKGRALVLEAYEAAGALHGAIARTAEDVYSRFTPDQADLARRILLRLITPGEGTPDTRRPAPRAELDFADPTDTAMVLDRLAGARLLTLDHDTVDLAHEALIIGWPQLGAWINTDRDRLRTHRRLTEATEAWTMLDRDPGALYRGARLGIAEEAFATPGQQRELTAVEKEFLTASLDTRERERMAAVRTTRRLRSLVAALTALLLVACAAVAISLQERATARSERTTAISRQVAAEADRLRAADVPSSHQDEALAAQLDIAAYRMRPSPQTYTSLVGDATAPLFTEIREQKKDTPSRDYLPNNGRAAYDKAHRILALVGNDAIRLWDTTHFTRPKPVGRALPGWQVAMSPDGRVLAVANYDLTVSLWNTADLSHLRRLATLPPPGNSPGNFMAFSHDGNLLVIGGDHVSSLWDVHDHQHPEVLIRSLPADLAAFSPRRPLLATRDPDDGTVRLWDTSHHRRTTVLSVIRGRMTDGDILAFSPDGQTLATGGSDYGQVWLSDISKPRHPRLLNQNQAAHLNGQLSVPGGRDTDAVAYSPDSRLLAVIADTGIQLWDITVPDTPERLGQPMSRRSQGAIAVTFGPDGRSLIADDNQTLRVWRLPPLALLGCPALTPAGFSSDGRTMATVCSDGLVQLWDTATPDAPRPVGGSLPGSAAVFAPRGRLLAVETPDGGLRLYDTTDPSHPRCLGRIPVAKGQDVGAMAFDSKGNTLITYEERAGGKDGSAGAVQDDGIRARIWDIADPSRPRPAGTGILRENELDVAPLTPSADGRMLATSDGGDGIHLWDMSNPTHPVRRGGTLHGSAVAFAPNGHYLAVGSQERTIRLWDTTRPSQPTPLGTPFRADGAVDEAVVSPDSRSLAIRTSEGEIQLWDTSNPLRPSGSGHSFTGQASFLGSLLFSPDSQTLATGAEQGAVRMWILDATRAIRRICAATGHVLTRAAWKQYVAGLPYHPPCPG